MPYIKARWGNISKIEALQRLVDTWNRRRDRGEA
jgi:hypothetical protein